ncbi:triphosphoribosyl-dephospho-CoA synthase MdcB (plasmid) [Cupriavidus sp. P-10]|uniref:triphosphoribosyl-dephospho-CoA synthase MdcB n=1 Tax=Cupriavidus sp. P-10 TaxID=2027911 RepID=UPI000E2F8D33|nr:triphosphoribosyl-dephospho-CoA synthase MdcB [Cupriavidus sp. P-10]BDB30012.1 triphosphoribosyl-dephospho-CoA synthase MdcB [Cupriavidus sp. P-10]
MLKQPALASPASPAIAARNAAVRALLGELVTYPKPGLVSLVDTGSHADMDSATFVRSTLSLRHYFFDMARAGAAGEAFRTLRDIAIEAEARMLRATGGINTHRGAIFHIGLLAAAAGWREQRDATRREPLGSLVRHRWGEDIARHGRRADAHGNRASDRYGVGGAPAEAAAGFPSVYRLALPAYRFALARTGSPNHARVQAFFALMSALDDTNLLHRGGAQGLAFARAIARSFLQAGGVLAPGWQDCAVRIHHAFRERWLSPGGSADLLAVCLFIHAMEG